MSNASENEPCLSLAEAQPPFFAGIDVGGTNIKLGIVDDQGRTVAYQSIPTQQEQGPKGAARRCAEVLSAMIQEAGLSISDIRRAGLATPGPMDIPSGMLLGPGNLPEWHNTPIRDLFAKATGLPVTFANDANAAAWGEYWRGAGAEYPSIVLITLGTGVGGGIVMGDYLVEGAHSCGAEIGHIIIDSADDAPINALGIRGTLEGYCGAVGIVRQAEQLLASSSDPSLLREAISQGAELTPLAISRAAEAGDAHALRVVMSTAKYLAIGVVTAIHMIDPDGVVIGGGVDFGGSGTPLGERFIEEVRTASPTADDRVAAGPGPHRFCRAGGGRRLYRRRGPRAAGRGPSFSLGTYQGQLAERRKPPGGSPEGLRPAAAKTTSPVGPQDRSNW